MWPSRGPSVTGTLLGLAVAVLVAAYALHWAAELLREAAPVLLPAAGLVLLTALVLRWLRYRRDGW